MSIIHSSIAYEISFVDPVSDLFLNNHDGLIADHSYSKYKGNCVRANQALFNERGDVVAEVGSMVYVRIYNAYFLQNGLRHSMYWTHKSHTIPLTDSFKYAIPRGIRSDDHRSFNPENTVVIIRPYICKETGFTYSAGTRFVYTKKTKKHFHILIYDPTSSVVHRCLLPCSLCVPHKEGFAERKRVFVDILKEWVCNFIIPYLWGGTSIIQSVSGSPMLVEDDWLWSNDGKTLSGCDCSGLVLRAAQMAGIDYFCRNTLTMAQVLEQRPPYEKIEDGDLIYFPGHVIVVSDVVHNKIIESTGYASLYGYVHEISIGKRFRNIETLSQLHAACERGDTLELLAKDGSSTSRIEKCVILKFKQS